MKDTIEHIDTSEFPNKFRKCRDLPSANRKVLSKMKDDNDGNILTEFVWLRFKMYALRTEDKETKRAKEVKKQVVEHGISFNDYKSCLIDGAKQYKCMNIIWRRKHELHTEEVSKLALSLHDNQLEVLEDGVSTKSWGAKG